MNEKTFGLLLGIGFALIIMIISVSLTLLFIYYIQPDFVCELCNGSQNCSIENLLNINYP